MAEGVALVTGAGRGIGLATAQRLARGGFAVGVLDLDTERARGAAAALVAAGHRAYPATADITRTAQVARALARVESALGPVRVLVNNAAVAAPEPTRAEDVDPAYFRLVVDVNLNGTFLVSQIVGRALIERRTPGAIVNIASIYGMRALDHRLYDTARAAERFDDAAYHASKAGVIQLTRSLAVSWAPFGIRVNSVSPGPVDNEGSREVLPPAVLRRIAGRVPLGRLASVEDIAHAVAYLASDDAAYVTGANLVVDGGWVAW